MQYIIYIHYEEHSAHKCPANELTANIYVRPVHSKREVGTCPRAMYVNDLGYISSDHGWSRSQPGERRLHRNAAQSGMRAAV